jgi:hypothetical protein
MLLLTGCAHLGALAPDEVLRRAVAAGGVLQSAALTGKLTADVREEGKRAQGEAAFTGIIQGGGSEAQLQTTLQGTFEEQGNASQVQAAFDVVSASRQGTFFYFRSFTVSPASSSLRAEGVMPFLEKWWMLPASGKQPALTLTPDPKFLRMQAEVVKVTHDKGIRSVDDRKAYVYTVALDPEKLLQFLRRATEQAGEVFDEEQARLDLQGWSAEGELWIDTQTFYLHRLQWTLRHAAPQATDRTITLELDVHDHDHAQNVMIPEGAAPLPALPDLLQALSGSSAQLPVSASSSSRG